MALGTMKYCGALRVESVPVTAIGTRTGGGGTPMSCMRGTMSRPSASCENRLSTTHRGGSIASIQAVLTEPSLDSTSSRTAVPKSVIAVPTG